MQGYEVTNSHQSFIRSGERGGEGDGGRVKHANRGKSHPDRVDSSQYWILTPKRRVTGTTLFRHDFYISFTSLVYTYQCSTCSTFGSFSLFSLMGLKLCPFSKCIFLISLQ